MNGGLIKSCELVARVRSGRVVKSGMNGIVLYNAAWYEKHMDTELRRCGVWEETGHFAWTCSLCGKISYDKDPYCWNCGAKMEDDKRKRGTWKEFCLNGQKYYECSKCRRAYPIKHLTCPNCKTRMVLYLKTNGTEDEK